MKIVAFAGGVGGAKFADGLSGCLPPGDLTVIVNTGDDFEYWGLNISPDVDTVCYTLAGLANPETGWGRVNETWEVYENMLKIEAQGWFHIGDRDLATHLERTRRLKTGQTLSQITRDFCHSWGVQQNILPMTDDHFSTVVDTLELGELAFQEYFVHQGCTPTVKGFRFDGMDHARPAPGVLEAVSVAEAVVFCPSNPWVSLDPILKLHGVRQALSNKKVVAVSPIIGGRTVKGPAAKMFSELGIEPSPYAVAEHYRELLNGFILDIQDINWQEKIQALNMRTLPVNTIMKTNADRRQLAQDVLHFIKRD